MIETIRSTYLAVFGRQPDDEFSDETLLQYAGYYDEDVLRLVIQTCAGRLVLRTLGTPSHDDPIGRDP